MFFRRTWMIHFFPCRNSTRTVIQLLICNRPATMQNLPLYFVLVFVQVWGTHCGLLDPFDEFHNNSGLHKIMSGINELAANVGKIGAKLFNSSKPGVVKVEEYHVHEQWEVTTWSSINEHEVRFHGYRGKSNTSKVEDHEARYHGKPQPSSSLQEHESQYHGSDKGHHTENLKEHEVRFHNNPDKPCEDLNQHETKHHGRSGNMEEHERKYHKNRVMFNSIVAEHEMEFHDVKKNYSSTMEEHIARFHSKDDLHDEEFERVRNHEENLHGKARCPYKKACHYVTENAHWFFLGGAALFSMVFL
uniref:Uncharacterized protein n=1 Tax=Cacopsylla melanoneura TaxID=428564 RepID=A0A8D8R778_9HEMI